MVKRMGIFPRGIGRWMIVGIVIICTDKLLWAASPWPSLPGMLVATGEVVPWQKLFADQDWYKKGPPQEIIIRGKLEAVPKPEGPSILMRTYYYRLRQWNIYTGGKRVPLLDQYVGQEVDILGKEVKLALEGLQLLEFWPAKIRRAMPHPKWPKLPGKPPSAGPDKATEPAPPSPPPDQEPKPPSEKPTESKPQPPNQPVEKTSESQEAKSPTEKPSEPVWQKLFADQEWYQQAAGKEQIFRGRLEAIPQKPAIGILMRASLYRLGDRTIYTGARKLEVLDRLVGQEVEILGKAVDMALEGQQVREIWPAAVRPAPAPLAPPDAKTGASRPNVLFIAVDDLRPQLGCYGDRLVRSANLWHAAPGHFQASRSHYRMRSSETASSHGKAPFFGPFCPLRTIGRPAGW